MFNDILTADGSRPITFINHVLPHKSWQLKTLVNKAALQFNGVLFIKDSLLTMVSVTMHLTHYSMIEGFIDRA